ncbi:MAG: hypothetical protein SF162_06715 [bacterium]|nr:hypothetical protein [bacterium]
MMNIESFLLTTAQVGVALAGFSALITSFRRRDRPLLPTEITGRNMILEIGLATTYFALFPFPLEALLSVFGVVGVWRISSLMLLIFLIAWSSFNFTRFRRLSQLEGLTRLGLGLEITLLVMGFLLALNMLVFGNSAFYMIALLSLTSIASMQFLTFVYQYSRPGE